MVWHSLMMISKLNSLVWGACLLLLISAELRAADTDTDYWANSGPWFNSSLNECRDYSGTTVVIVDPHQKSGGTERLERLDVIFENNLAGRFVVLALPPKVSSGEAVDFELIAAYCRLAYETHTPVFNAATDGSDIGRDGFALSDSSQSTTRTVHVYYPIGKNGNLLTEFSGGSKLQDEILIRSIEAALENS